MTAYYIAAVEEPSESLLAFADDNDLTIHHLGLQEGNNPWDPLTVDCVMDAVQVRTGRRKLSRDGQYGWTDVRPHNSNSSMSEISQY